MQKQFKRYSQYLLVKDTERLCKIFNVPHESFLKVLSGKSFTVGSHECYSTEEVVSFFKKAITTKE